MLKQQAVFKDLKFRTLSCDWSKMYFDLFSQTVTSKYILGP